MKNIQKKRKNTNIQNKLDQFLFILTSTEVKKKELHLVKHKYLFF